MKWYRLFCDALASDGENSKGIALRAKLWDMTGVDLGYCRDAAGFSLDQESEYREMLVDRVGSCVTENEYPGLPLPSPSNFFWDQSGGYFSVALEDTLKGFEWIKGADTHPAIWGMVKRVDAGSPEFSILERVVGHDFGGYLTQIGGIDLDTALESGRIRKYLAEMNPLCVVRGPYGFRTLPLSTGETKEDYTEVIDWGRTVVDYYSTKGKNRGRCMVTLEKSKIEARPELQEVFRCCFDNFCYKTWPWIEFIDSPATITMRTEPVKKRKPGKASFNLAGKPIYIVKNEPQMRSLNKKAHQGGSVTPHFRRGHWRYLRSEKYRFKRFQRVRVRETIIGSKEFVAGGRKYVVIDSQNLPWQREQGA